MQSSAIALSPSTPFLKPPRLIAICKLSQLSVSTSFLHLHRISNVQKLYWQTATGTFSSYTSSFYAESPASFLASNRRCDSLKVKAAQPAAPGPESAGEASESSGLARTLQLGAMFGIWYLLNIYFNIYNKQVNYLYLYTSDPSVWIVNSCFEILKYMITALGLWYTQMNSLQHFRSTFIFTELFPYLVSIDTGLACVWNTHKKAMQWHLSA